MATIPTLPEITAVTGDDLLVSHDITTNRSGRVSAALLKEYIALALNVDQDIDAGSVVYNGSNVKTQLDKAVKTVPTFADISAALPSLEIGQQISTLGHTVVGVGGGIFDVVSSSGLTSDGGLVVVNGAKAAKRKTERSVSPVMFGAVGDNITDDIVAFNKSISTNTRQDHIGGNYLLDLSPRHATNDPQISSDNGDISNSVVKTKAKDYSIGPPGTQDYYTVWVASGDHSNIHNNSFDGNNSFDYTPYQPSGSNAWCVPVYIREGYGQKAIQNSIVDCGGHAIQGSSGDSQVIALNSAKKHNGIGSTNTPGLVVTGNISKTTSDSHYFINTCQFGSIVGNVGTGNNGGGGIDLAGASDFVAAGNSISGGQANGIWPLKSPNTGALYSRLLISSNVLYNNCNYPNNEQGEIQIGDYNNLEEYQGSDVAVIGNLISPRDTPTAAGYNPSVWVHGNTDNTAVLSNVFNPDDNLVSSSQPSIVDAGSKSPVYAYNVKCGLTPSYLYFSAAPSDNSVYYGNVGLRVHPSSVAVPKTMRSQDGVWEYHIVRKLTKAGKNLIDIAYSGGFIHDLIEVTVSSRNTNGITKRRIVTSGTNASTVSILENTVITSVGAHPPLITTDVTTAGTLRIMAAIDPAGADNEDTSLHIKILTPADSPTRFSPLFI